MKPARLAAILVLVPAVVLAAAWIHPVFGQQAQANGPTYKDVAPIFQTRCTQCHAGPKASKGLHLDTYEGVINGSDEKMVIPGNPAKSPLFLKITGALKPRMPKNGPPWLSEQQTTLIEQWIAKGAPR